MYLYIYVVTYLCARRYWWQRIYLCMYVEEIVEERVLEETVDVKGLWLYTYLYVFMCLLELYIWVCLYISICVEEVDVERVLEELIPVKGIYYCIHDYELHEYVCGCMYISMHIYIYIYMNIHISKQICIYFMFSWGDKSYQGGNIIYRYVHIYINVNR
jgi:hypothetical protein